MSDLQVLALFRLAQANGTIRKLTKTTHDCAGSACEDCIARPACRFIVNVHTTNSFKVNYRVWTLRTPLLTLRQLEQQYPELLI